MLFSNNSFVRKNQHKTKFWCKIHSLKIQFNIFPIPNEKDSELFKCEFPLCEEEKNKAFKSNEMEKFRTLNIFFPFNGLLIRRSMKQKNFLILELCTPHTVFFIPHSKMVLWTETPYKRPQQKQQFRTLSCTMLCHFVSMLLSVVGCGRSLYFSINGFSEIFTRLKIVSIWINE